MIEPPPIGDFQAEVGLVNKRTGDAALFTADHNKERNGQIGLVDRDGTIPGRTGDGQAVRSASGSSIECCLRHGSGHQFCSAGRGAGHDARGRLCGFNFTDNQVEDQESYNENCIWQDGKIQLLPPVKFAFNPADYLQPWTVRDTRGRVDLTFRPEVVRSVDVNALVIRSNYRAPFGAFSGRIRPEGGEEASVDGYFGMCENFYLRT